MRIGYARVSTDDQSTSLQLVALRAAGCKRIYQEKISGKVRMRPKLRAAFTSLRPGDQIVVWRLDRLGRDFGHLCDLADELRRKEANLISLTEGIDTASSVGEVIYRLFCVFADFERNVIVERTRAGLAAARTRGVRLGGKPKLSSEQIDAARALVASGMSVEAAAARFRVGRSTMYRNLGPGS